jgi:hypothetical protein
LTSASQTESIRGELGQGVYALADLRAFVGYTGDGADSKRTLDWLTVILNPAGHTRRQPDWSFSDLISVFVVRELLRTGVPPRTIRAAEKYLRRKLVTDRPFVSDRIATDGRHVLHDDQIAGEPEQVESADLEGQQVMVEPIRDQLTSVHYSDGWAMRWTPAERIVVDPAVQFGAPVIEGTRLRTADLAAVATEVGAALAARRLNVDVSTAEAAVDFERRLAAFR